MSEEKKLTIAEIVQITGVPRPTVFKWVKRGKFPNAEKITEKTNKYWVIPESDFLAIETELREIKLGRPRKEE